jgi:hypothetical protein
LANGEYNDVVEAFGVIPNRELSIRFIPVIDDRVPLLFGRSLVTVDLRDLRDLRDRRLGCNFFHIEGFLDTIGVALVEDMV